MSDLRRYRLARSLGIATIFIIAIAAIIVVQTRVQKAVAAQYFAAVLRTLNISETVMVGHITYQVEHGTIRAMNGRPIAPADSFDVLRTAYALSLARRAPILDLAGTDPDALSTSTKQLARVQAQLADLQKTSQAHAAVGTALYPIRFLELLSTLEKARLTFINTGSSTLDSAYQTALTRTLNEGAKDLALFEGAYAATAADNRSSYATLSGVVSKRSTMHALQQLDDAYHSASARHIAVLNCIGGDISLCEPSDLVTNIRDAAVANVAEVPSSAGDSIRILANAHHVDYSNTTVVALAQSACVGSQPGPYFFISEPLQNKQSSSLTFVNDLFFHPLSGNIPNNAAMLLWFRAQEVSYLFYNPMSYYTCPNNMLDMAKAYAVQHAAALSHTASTSSVTGGMTLLLESKITAELSRRLRDERTATSTPSDIDSVLNTYLMMKDNSASFETLVAEIAASEAADIAMTKRGTPADTSAEFLFASQSGYFALFLAHNRSLAPDAITPYTDDPLPDRLRFALSTWSYLRSSVPTKKIEHDLQIYFSSHQY